MIEENDKIDIYKKMVDYFFSNNEVMQDPKMKKAMSDMLLFLRKLLNINYDKHCDISREIILARMENERGGEEMHPEANPSMDLAFSQDINFEIIEEPKRPKTKQKAGRERTKKGLGRKEKKKSENVKSGIPGRTISSINTIGIGNAGLNVLGELTNENMGVEGRGNIIGFDTCLEDIRQSIVPNRKYIGDGITGERGAELNRKLGKKAGKQLLTREMELIKLSDVLIVTFGLGGGTGTGTGAELVKGAKKTGKIVIPVVTLPFREEGAIKKENASAGYRKILKYADLTIVLPNDYLTTLEPNLPLLKGFKIMDKILAHTISGVRWLLEQRPNRAIDYFTRNITAGVSFGRDVDIYKCWSSVREDIEERHMYRPITDVLILSSAEEELNQKMRSDFRIDVQNTFSDAKNVIFVENTSRNNYAPVELMVLFGPLNPMF